LRKFGVYILPDGERMIATPAGEGRTFLYSRRLGVASRPFFVINEEGQIMSYPDGREISWNVEQLTDSGETYQG
jgi:hypothetical protein